VRRREFIKVGALTGAGLALPGAAGVVESAEPQRGKGPVVVSTWSFGREANQAAYKTLSAGGTALDAVQGGVMVSEADPEVSSVGLGGWPNREGVVELDASIMDGETLQAGAVAGVRDILHPVAVARLVMETTPHVMLVGDGARRFALGHGFDAVNLLTPEARRRWQKEMSGETDAERGHDTIGMIAMDDRGRMAGACTTSGLAWKLPGRVGDSPLIGHGMYCDSEAGGAAATGVGEEVIKVCGSYQVVEFMRQGLDPDEAVRRVLQRILRRDPDNAGLFVGFVALRADGKAGFASTIPEFQVAISRKGKHKLIDAPALLNKAAA